MKLSERERQTLKLVCDTFFPTLDGPSPFYHRRASDLRVDTALAETIESALQPGRARDFRRVLGIFDSRLYNLLLSARPSRFSAMSLKERTRYLAAWRDSPIPLKRTAFQALKRLSCFLAYSVTDKNDLNPNWEEIGYPGPQKIHPTRHPEELRIAPIVPENGLSLECDVCIVGSGAGGSVIAHELSRAGHRVVVLEQGGYETSETFRQSELAMMQKLFQQMGTASTNDLSFTLLAGRGAGGGTTVNWNTSLKPPLRVLKEWETEFGVEELTAPNFQSHLDEIWNTLRVNANESQMNWNNRALWEGCKALGYREGVDFEVISRNAVGCEKRCDFCGYGCIYACKQSTVMNYLPMAFRNGARFLFNTRAESVIIDNGFAKGVRATYEGAGKNLSIEVRSRVVVVASGGIETPALLLRSGIDDKNIGNYLTLDPTVPVGGVFNRVVGAWAGPPQTVAVRKFIDLDGSYHGFWVEVAPAHPGLFAFSIPWVDGRSHKDFMKNFYSRSTDAIVLLRERGWGRVTTDKDGFPVVSYELDGRDRMTMMRGMEETARILSAAGAVCIWTTHNEPVMVGDGESTLTQSDLDRFSSALRKRGIERNRLMLFSAHLMGSCRMSANPALGPTRPDGELHAVSNLFIGDACVFPTTPGVNPMITIMAMARRTSEFIRAKLKQE